MSTVDTLIKEVYPWAREIRRDLHRNPEVSYKEFRTTELIVRELELMGYEVSRPLEAGCVAVLRGGVESGRVVALRADIDALPMQEIPGSFMYLGSGSPDSGSNVYNWHHPLYNADERSIETGMNVFVGLVMGRFSPIDSLNPLISPVIGSLHGSGSGSGG